MNVSTLQPRRHDPPAGWSPAVFDALTSALAAALVAAYRRAQQASESPDVEVPR